MMNISIILISRRIASILISSIDLFINEFTYQAHFTSYIIALIVQTIIQENKLLSHVIKLEILLKILLHERIASLPQVNDIRGKGLLWGVEFVCDKSFKGVFQTERACASVARAVFLKDVQIYVCKSVADGKRGDAILFTSAFNCDEKDIKMMIKIVAEAIEESLPQFIEIKP